MALPDLIEIVPLDQPVRAEITVPGSKSITNRALVLAAFADGEVTLKGALWSEDTQIMVDCLKKLGFAVNVAPDPDEPCNRTIIVRGRGGEVPPGGSESNPLELFVGNAGTAARFLAPFLCLGSGVYRLHGVPRMHERPQAALFQALRELGYRVESENANDKLPARIFACRSRREEAQTEKRCKVSIEESSQFASALLLSSKTGGWQIEIVGENADESPYVVMTSKLMEVFPKQGGVFQIEPDASSGSYFWAAGWIVAGGLWNPPKLSVEHIQESFSVKAEATAEQTWEKFKGRLFEKHSLVVLKEWPESEWQVDSKFIRYGVLDKRKAAITFAEKLRMPKVIPEISRASDLGDSIMTLIAIAPLAERVTEDAVKFTHLGRLRVQECERVVALRTELTKCGAKVVEEGDTLTVYPSKPGEFHGAEIETYNDHRMAMCFAILGLKVPGIRIKNPACVKKTFPNFFQKLAAPPPHGLGAEIWEVKNGQRTRKLSGEDLFAD